MKKALINYIQNEKFDDLSFEEKLKLKIEYVLTLPVTPETIIILNNLKWVLEIYQEDKKKGKVR